MLRYLWWICCYKKEITLKRLGVVATINETKCFFIKMRTENIWKNAVGYDDIYHISNKGDLKSLKRILVKRNCLCSLPEKIMTPQLHKEGYLCVRLTDKDKNKKTVKMHRLVAMAFIPNPENKQFVNHINGIKHDNRVENLEWVTKSENTIHAYKLGLMNHRIGENCYQTTLTDAQVLEIRAIGKSMRCVDVAQKYNVAQYVIWNILSRKTWKHI